MTRVFHTAIRLRESTGGGFRCRRAALFSAIAISSLGTHLFASTARQVLVAPVQIPKSGAVTAPNANDIRAAYRDTYEEFWDAISYGTFPVKTKTYGYGHLPWSKVPPTGATAGPDFNQDGVAGTGAGEDFSDDPSDSDFIPPPFGGEPLNDGFFTPGERFRDNNGDGVYTEADPWTDVYSTNDDSEADIWDAHGERFVDINGNGEYDNAVNLEIYDRALDVADGYQDGMIGDPTAGIQLQPANRSIVVDELFPSVAMFAAHPGLDPQGSDIQSFNGDFSTRNYDNMANPTEAVQPPNGKLDTQGEPNATGTTFTVRTYEVDFDGENGTNESTEVNTDYTVYEYDEPYTDADDNGAWTNRDPFEDYLVRWAPGVGWVQVTQEYMIDNYPPFTHADGSIVDDGPGGPEGWRFPNSTAGNGIADNIDELWSRTGNGQFDGREWFQDIGDTKIKLSGAGPQTSEPAFWDPHGWYGSFEQWWEDTFGTDAPDFPGNINTGSEFNPSNVRPFVITEANFIPALGEDEDSGSGDIYPDATGAYYDGAREFRDMPSSIYHTDGDRRLGEETDPNSNTAWGTDKGKNDPDEVFPDSIINAAGPLAWNIHGDFGYDAGNQWSIELLTWRTDGTSLADTVTSNSDRQGGWIGADDADRRCRDNNLNGLVDQGEAPDAGFNNYIVDLDPNTNPNNGSLTDYPYNRIRFAEDVVELLDAIEDFEQFIVPGSNIVDYLVGLYPDGYPGTDFQGLSGMQFSVLTRDREEPISFGGQVLTMSATPEGATGGAVTPFAMGTVAHEQHHDWFGAPDLYDYDVFNGNITNNPIGRFDLMATGGLVHGIGPLATATGLTQERDLKGILEPGQITTLRLHPVEQNPNQYYVFNRNGGKEQYWFWYESDDTDFSKGLGAGVAIAHVDLGHNPEAIPEQQRHNNHFTYELVQADGQNHLQDGANTGDDGDFWPGSTGKTTFNADTVPASRWYDGAFTGIEILNINLPSDPNAPAEVTFRWAAQSVPDDPNPDEDDDDPPASSGPAPTVSGADNSSISTPTWTWTGTTAGTGLFRYQLNGRDEQAWTQTLDTSLTPAQPLTDGSHTLFVQERAANGAWSESGRFTTTIDTRVPGAPAVRGASPTTNPRPQWTWSDDDATEFRFQLDGQNAEAWTRTTARQFTPGENLTDGVHTLRVQKRNDAGTWSLSGTRSILVDTQAPAPPQVRSLRPDVRTPISKRTVLLQWDDADDGDGAGVAGYAWTLDTATETAPQPSISGTTPPAEFELPDASGTYRLHIRAMDQLGNWSATAHIGPWNLDVDPPDPPKTSSPGIVASATPTWQWEASDNGIQQFRYRLNDERADAWEITEETTFTPESSLDDGTHTLHVQQRDAAGNWSATASADVVIDTNAPAPPQLEAADPTVGTTMTTANITLRWRGQGDTDSDIAGYSWEFGNDREQAVDTTIDGDQPPQVLTVPSAPGIYWLRIRTVDKAGNASEPQAYGPWNRGDERSFAWNIHLYVDDQYIETVELVSQAGARRSFHPADGDRQNNRDEENRSFTLTAWTPDGTALSKDVQPPDEHLEWYLEFSTAERGTRNGQAQLRWDRPKLPGGLYTDLVPSDADFLPLEASGFNPLRGNRFDLHPDASGTDRILVRAGTRTQTTLPLDPGWNLISLPLELDTVSQSAIFANSDINSIYGWNSMTQSYFRADRMQPRQGYWIYATSATSITLTGRPSTAAATALELGWNLVGPSKPMRTPHHESPAVSACWQWKRNNGYTPPDSDKRGTNASACRPGTAYWIYSNTNGTSIWEPSFPSF